MYDHKLFIEDFGDENIIVRNRTISKKWLKNNLYQRYHFDFLNKYS